MKNASSILKARSILTKVGCTIMGTHKVRTWCESTQEGEDYLRFNGYGMVRRIGTSGLYKTTQIGNKLRDVEIIK